MLTIKNYLAQAGNKGVGVFAGEDIKKGQTVWVFDINFTRTYNDADVQKMPDYQQEFVKKYAYTDHSNPSVWILDLDNGRFMNHDDNPNSDYDLKTGWATRDIKKGEEITCDYRDFDTQELDFLV